MNRMVNVTIEAGGSFRARTGQRLLDAALLSGVDAPHDCRAGHCGSCRCTVVSGAVAGGEIDDTNAVLACQAHLVGDVTIAFDEAPPVETRTGRLRALRKISADVAEATIELKEPFEYLPGQYCQFRFTGFPSRCYSPTAPLTGPNDRGQLRLHIRLIPKGRVSQALGRAIKPGHKVKIVGPYGSAFLRPGKAQRLVLAASGTGFAPIWGIALAALAEMPDREIIAVVGARTRNSFYMASGLKRLLAFPKTKVVPVLQSGEADGSIVRIGGPADFLPRLAPDDLVYAAGGPNMVQAVSNIAHAAGATCYADPFAPAEPGRLALTAPALIANASRAVGRMFLSAGGRAA